MKIAVSGAHRTGKTTLIEELVALRPDFEVVDEPYWQLAEEGHAFAETPGIDDFELQLERSIESILGIEGEVVFDRCPLDLLAYLATHDDADAFDVDRRLPRVEEAMQQLDLIVFVPIEEPDRIGPSDDDPWRRQVDEELQETVLNDRWGFGVPVIEVVGSPGERAIRAVARIEEARGR